MVAQEEFAALKAEIERRDRQSRRRAVVLTAVPVLIAGVLLCITFLRVWDAQRKVDSYQREAAQAQLKLKELTEILNSVEQRLRESTEFRQNVHPLRWETPKIIGSRYPQQSRVLLDIVEMNARNVKWKLGGMSPDEGFDSPGFAAYLLNKHRILNVSLAQRYHLRELVESAGTPRVGDLAFYDTGYTMFYFIDERDRPFCVGMTPAGIIAVDPDFGPRLLGYGRIQYR